MRGLFIMGNKRSGSTHLMRLLNLHPEIYVSNESDIIWILYNFYQQKEYSVYPYDAPAGMTKSLKIAEGQLDRTDTPVQNFHRYQRKLMETGFLTLPPMKKENVAYIGDQKPFQHADPVLIQFILEHFDRPKFLHILRHPFQVVASAKDFIGGTGGYIWKGMTAQEILAKWEMHEQWVKEAKEKYHIDVFEVRYDTLIKNPKKQMKEIFNFLELDDHKDILKEAQRKTRKNYKAFHNLSLSPSQKNVLNDYGMPIRFNAYHRIIRPWYYKHIYHFARRTKRKLQSLVQG